MRKVDPCVSAKSREMTVGPSSFDPRDMTLLFFWYMTLAFWTITIPLCL